MSHAATNWAIQQRGLKPATKLVLWYLGDCHNPHLGCFPSQERLAYDAEMARSTLNQHLKILEEKGLIRRVQQINPKTRKQENTRYILAFEKEFEPRHVVEPCPEIGHGAVSGKEQIPCPENDDSRVRNPDTNPVREPVIEPRARADAPRREDFDMLWSGWSEHSRPHSIEAAWIEFSKLDPAEVPDVLEAAVNFQTAMSRRKKTPRMIPFLKAFAWKEFAKRPEIDRDGDFVIRPGTPGWSEWLGDIRNRFGARAVDTVVRQGFICRKTRSPTKISLA